MNESYQQLVSFVRKLHRYHIPPIESNASADTPDLKTLSVQYLPWLLGDFHNRDGETWTHRIYIGVMTRREALALLYRQHRQELPLLAADNTPTYLFSFALNSEGCAMADSLSINPWCDVLTQTAIKREKLAKEFAQRWRIEDHAQTGTRIAGFKRLCSERDTMLSAAGIKDWVAAKSIHVLSMQNRHAQITETTQLLHEAAIADNDHIIAQLSDRAPGTVFIRLFAQDNSLSRKDIMENMQSLLTSVQPQYLPKGSVRAEGLYLCEQAAVNEVRQLLAKQEGVLSIHTPMGTTQQGVMGELVANLFTDRAEVLRQWDDPTQLFTPSEPADTQAHLPAGLSDRLHSALLCTDQVPQTGVDYIDQWQSMLLNPGKGNVWFDSLSTHLCEHYQRDINDQQAWLGLWRQACAAYQKARLSFISRRDQLADTAAQLAELGRARMSLSQAKAGLHTAEQQFREFQDRVQTMEAELAELESRIEADHAKLQNLEQHRPRALFLQTPAFKKWEHEVLTGRENIAALAKEKLRVHERLRALHAQFSHLEKAFHSKQSEWDELTTRIAAMQAELLRIGNEHITLPDDVFWSLSKRHQKLSRLWHHPPLQQDRLALSAAAVDMQAAWVMANRQTIHAALQQSHRTDQQREWLALCSPLIHLPLNRLPYLFGNEHSGDWDWIIVDQAHRAPMYQAMAAVWRAKRLVTFGDRMQQHRAVALPRTQWQFIAGHLENLEQATELAGAGLQCFADRASIRGTYVRLSKSSRLWVGLPLRVTESHGALVDIANYVCCDGQLVADPAVGNTRELPDNQWLNIDYKTEASYRRAVTQELRGLQKVLLDAGVDDYLLTELHFNSLQKNHKVIGFSDLGNRRADVVILVLGNIKTVNSNDFRPDMLASRLITRARYRLYIMGDRSQWLKIPPFNDIAACTDGTEAANLAVASVIHHE